MLVILETLPNLDKIVLKELAIRNVPVNVKYSDQTSLIIEVSEEYVKLLRKLQTVTRLERCITWIPYVNDIKEFRKVVRKTLREYSDYFEHGSIVNVVSRDVRDKILKILIREIERVFKCRLTRSRGDYEIYVRFFNRGFLICINIGSIQPLYRRWYTVYKSRASLNPILAATMSIIAGRYDVVLDPFAGSLTIPIEYVRFWKNTHVKCVDIEYEVLKKSILNLKVLDILDKVDILCGDYFKIRFRDIECIITDPPRGLRLRSSIELYLKFLQKASWEIVDYGCIVFITFSKIFKNIGRELQKLNLEVVDRVDTVQGGYKVSIVKLVRK